MEFRAPVLVRHAGGGAATLQQLPPGFRFRPTDEELVVQYLRRKAFGVPLPAAGVIPVVRDLYGLDPWDIIPGASDGGEKYFFAIRRPAAKTGGGKNDGAIITASGGRWKPAGKERPVVLRRPCGGSLLVGVKRALAFAPRRRGKKTTKRASSAGLLTTAGGGWVMHEYRLAATLHKNGCSLAAAAEGEWVVCRVFRRSRQQPRRSRAAVPPGDGTAPSRTMMMPASLSSAASSASSCVTDGSSDQEEVSS